MNKIACKVIPEDLHTSLILYPPSNNQGQLIELDEKVFNHFCYISKEYEVIRQLIIKELEKVQPIITSSDLPIEVPYKFQLGKKYERADGSIVKFIAYDEYYKNYPLQFVSASNRVEYYTIDGKYHIVESPSYFDIISTEPVGEI